MPKIRFYGENFQNTLNAKLQYVLCSTETCHKNYSESLGLSCITDIIINPIYVVMFIGFGLMTHLFDSLIRHMTTLYNSLSHTYTHMHTRISVHSYSFPNCCSVLASSGFPYYPVSATSFSHQQLTMTETQSWLFTANQFILAPNTLSLMTRDVFGN
jgi:hypothetical protein